MGLEDNSTFSYSATEYCSNDTDPSPTIAGTSGGKFTSTIGLVIDSLTGTIDLDSSSSGTYVVTYTTPLPEQTIQVVLYLRLVQIQHGLMFMYWHNLQMELQAKIHKP